MRCSYVLFIAIFRLSGNLNMLYPEKNRVQAKRNDQCVNDNTPLPNPEWILPIKWKENIGWALVSQHVNENMREPSKKATEVNGFERIPHLFGKELEKPINAKDGFLEAPLSYIND